MQCAGGRAKFVQHTLAPSLGIAFAGIRKLDDLVKAAGMTAKLGPLYSETELGWAGGADKSSGYILALDCIEEGRHLGWRPNVVNLLRSRHISDKLPEPGRQSAGGKAKPPCSCPSCCATSDCFPASPPVVAKQAF